MAFTTTDPHFVEIFMLEFPLSASSLRSDGSISQMATLSWYSEESFPCSLDVP